MGWKKEHGQVGTGRGRGMVIKVSRRMDLCRGLTLSRRLAQLTPRRE